LTSLSKSKILLHRQCPKRLWLSINHPELAKVNTATQTRFDEGNIVGDIARQNFPGGILIDTLKRSDALELTKEAIQKRRVIFEAAFFEDSVLIRADLLIPEGTSYRLVEVKSSTSVKDYHLDDVVVQAWVMTKAGISPKGVFLAHIDNQFVYQGDGNYAGLFAEEDLSERVRENLSKVQLWVDAANKTLNLNSEPSEPTGDRCVKPFVCDFFTYCNPPEKDVLYPVEVLP
jgi:predicted RecB family nuclease